MSCRFTFEFCGTYKGGVAPPHDALFKVTSSPDRQDFRVAFVGWPACRQPVGAVLYSKDSLKRRMCPSLPSPSNPQAA